MAEEVRMSRARAIAGSIVLLACCVWGFAQNAQPPADAPRGKTESQPAAAPANAPGATAAPAAAPTSAPADRTPITARVIEVKGDVKHAPLDSEDWKACQVGDEYPEQTVILTGVRSSVKFQIGADDTYTALVVEPASKTLLSQAYTTADSKRVNIGVGYGRIRAGVVEGGLKSNFTVESPVATLSKRGTWNFGLFYERSTDRFEIFLLDHGLVDAINQLTHEQRRVNTGEWVTNAMRRWADQAQLSRNVAISDFLGQADASVAFNRLREDGLRVLNPEGGQTVLINLSSAQSQSAFASTLRNALPPVLTVLPGAQGQARGEAFFGSGRGEQLVPVILGKDSTLVQQGLAQPGTYNFSRSAVEGWLKQHGGK